ncbi:MAG: S-methyl-5'-thioadenosine phosphorylase [Planctomycetota bacterium]
MEMTAVIGGSGLYELDGFELEEEKIVETPFGRPSAPIVIGSLQGRPLAFLPRHGRNHEFSPSTLPYRANIFALKTLGVTRVISVSAVGSMREEIKPGHVVLVDQFFDRTLNRKRTFFDDGIAAHVGFADPVCETLRQTLLGAVKTVGVPFHDRGTYVCIEGPQFSTRAESNVFRSWGVSVIGMTNLPEARLAREAEMAYATLALATDYDCWKEDEADVSVESVIAVLHQNVENARKIVRQAILDLPPTSESPAHTALTHAIMTSPDAIGEDLRQKLAPLIGRALS